MEAQWTKKNMENPSPIHTLIPIPYPLENYGCCMVPFMVPFPNWRPLSATGHVFGRQRCVALDDLQGHWRGGGNISRTKCKFCGFSQRENMGNGTIIELTGISVPCLITGGYLHIERTGSPLCVPFSQPKDWEVKILGTLTLHIAFTLLALL